MVSTKEEVYQYLEKISRDFTLKDLKYFTANDISETLSISRNLASQYLNELVKEKRALKVNSRPVYFFHKKNVERSSMLSLDTCIFSGLDEFILQTKKGMEKKDFERAIGHYISLAPCIEQCKAAMKYPPNGLSVLFYGASGTGKSFLARMMFEYGKNERILADAGNYISVDCTEYGADISAFSRNLHGDGSSPGWLAKADGGVLFFEEIDRLPMPCQEMLFSYLDSGTYRPLNQAERTFESRARLIFATSKQPEDILYKALARRIPITIPIPMLHERSGDEKEEMLVAFLRKEGARMGLDVSISKKAFYCLTEHFYDNNIDELKSCVTSSCANAYLEKQADVLAIGLHHLPDYLLAGMTLNLELGEERMLDLVSYSKSVSFQQATQYFQMILDEYQDYVKGGQGFAGLLGECQNHLKHYYDYLIYEQKLTDRKVTAYERLINQIFETVSDGYGVRLSKKYSYLLARSIYIQLRADHVVSRWVKDNVTELSGLFQIVRQSLAKEAVIATQIVDLVKQNLDVELNVLNQLFLLFDIKNQNDSIAAGCISGVIISHGYSTATSIADAANQMIGKRVFEAIDMPLDMQMSDIAGLLEQHIGRYITSRDMVLMVDMGSLEQINKEIKNLSNINIGIINNISTALAVDIGLGILAGKDMEAILKQASEHNVCTYRIIKNVQKPHAIVFSGENGIDTAEKIKDLIIKSLDTAVAVELVAYDYYRLQKNGLNDEIFRKYQVDCIIGLFNPEIEGVAFVALEDIISMQATPQLKRVFTPHLDDRQLEVFNRNMIKNFSFQNVVESITILNPAKLLDGVEYAVMRLQKMLGHKIEGRMINGLYVHLCCLIERLVTKTPIENYYNLDVFEREHEEFIRIVRACFDELTAHYRVEIPAGEIAYLYDYINIGGM
ncbi:MAG: sigma 54-interacting transcriptional regulator [Lachnospiraceae bacterium]|nr:sigma 54-interacting transcriptional regulator [Lachnospiraceae bacterium]